MQSLQIKPNENAQPAVYEPKLNYKFYKQARDDKQLATENQDGFSALVAGLLDENVDMIVDTYYHSFAWYRRNQPSRDAVEEALSSKIFASKEATDKAFMDILSEMKTDNFLARKLDEYLKKEDRNADMVQARIDSTDDKQEAGTMTIGLQQITKENDKLKSLIATDESSPKPDAAE